MIATTEVVVDAAFGGAWVNRTPIQVSRTGVNKNTPGSIRNVVSVKNAPSPVLIVIVATSPPCVLDVSLQVPNKRQSTSPTLDGNTQKLDAVIDRKLPDDLDSALVFSKVIGQKLSDSSSGDI